MAEILCVRFNQDVKCAAIGTTRGFQIFSTDPFTPRFHRDWGEGIGIVEILNRSNFVVLCGGGPKPKFPLNKIVVWDDYRATLMAELEFKSPIRNLQIRDEILVAVIEKEICVYQFNSLTMLTIIYTLPNPLGLCEIGTQGSPIILACPGVEPGDLYLGEVSTQTATLAPRIIAAHHAPINCLGVSADGQYVASASQKGTIIRVWKTIYNGKDIPLEFRRGHRNALIKSLAFSPDHELLAVISNTGTIHMFDLQAPTRSRAFLKIKTGFNNAVIAFGPNPGTLIVISYTGVWSRYSFHKDIMTHLWTCQPSELSVPFKP